MSDNKSHIKRFSFILSFLLMISARLVAQVELPPPVIDSNELALKFMKEQNLLHRVLISQDAGWYHIGERGGGNLTSFHLDRFVIDEQKAPDFQ